MNVQTRLTDGNMQFRRNTDPALLSRLAVNAEPSIAILGCSDCRVTPEKIFNLSMGDAFVVRIPGNCASEPAVMGSLEYSVETLRVRMIVVLGHTDCGAVKATVRDDVPEGLKGVARDIERARSRLSGQDANSVDAIAEANVRLQIGQITTNSCLIRDAVESGRLVITGCMYDISTGLVRLL